MNRSWKRIWIILIILSIIIISAFRLSPWPSVFIIRYLFNSESVKVNNALYKYVPKGIAEILDQPYGNNDKDANMDIYFPDRVKNTNQKLPAIIWIHGGGLISGDKSQLSNYCKILASKGYVVVSIDYSIAPEKIYPTPLLQTNEALKYLKKNAGLFHIDPFNFILAGDSGGAQIAAQMGMIISDSSYAGLVGIKPNMNKNEVAGLILYCGPYNMELVHPDGLSGFFLKTVLWSYSGKKDYMQDQYFKTASLIHYVSSDFPPCFISAGNGDPLQEHSLSFARKLAALHVQVDSLFYPSDLRPPLPHEYQFNLDSEAGKTAFQRSIYFLDSLKLQAHTH